MTNSDTTSSDAQPSAGRRRRIRAFLKGTFAAMVATLGVGIFATPAFAHDNIVTGSASCATSSTYTITWTIANDFNADETATVVATSAPGGLATVSGSPLTILASPTTPFTSGTVTQTVPATFVGTITLSVSGAWPNFTSTTPDVGSITLPPQGCTPANVGVVKTVSTGLPNNAVPAGSSTHVVYTLAVTNNGQVATALSTTVTDVIPAGTTYVAGSASCPAGTNGAGQPTCTANEASGVATFVLGAGIVPGATYDVSFAVTVNAGDPSGTIPNTANFTGPGCTTASPGCSSNTVTITVTNAVITVVKSANTGAVTAGQTDPVIYTLAVNNTSTVTTLSNVVVTDVVPTSLTFVSASCGALTASTTPSCTASYDPSTRTVTFTLGAGIVGGASELLSFRGTVNASATTTIVNSANFTGPGCTTAAPGCPTNPVPITVANFSVSKSDSAGSSNVDPGQVIDYTVTATNSGDGPGSITVTDTVPTGTTLSSPAPACPANTSATCAVSVTGSTISWVITNMPGTTSYALTYAVKVNSDATGHILNTGTYTEPGCTTVGGCSTNTTDNPVNPPTSTVGGNTPPPSPPPVVPPATTPAVATTPIAGATTVHTGEPWAGSTPYVLAVLAFGISLLSLGQLRRRRPARVPAE